MNEIDDDYKQEMEDVETRFLEELEHTKDRQKTINDYQKQLAILRKTFCHKYASYLKKESASICPLHAKPISPKTFAHLQVAHFDFSFNIFQRCLIRLNTVFYTVIRRYKKIISIIIPSRILYDYYFLKYFLKRVYCIFTEHVHSIFSFIIASISSFFVSLWKQVVLFSKKLFTLLRRFFGIFMGLIHRISFKKKSSEESESGGDKRSSDSEGDVTL